MAEPLSTIPAAVATHHPFATEAARQILHAGGNATDAAVAAMVTLCVVVPGSVALGGFGGSMLSFDAAANADHAVKCLDFDTRAPLGYRDDIYADDPRNKSTVGYLATSVPAIVAGLARALLDSGTRSWKEVTRFATELADDGFIVNAHHRTVLEQWHAKADALSRNAHFTGGVIPAIGDRWMQKDLARLLRRLADEGPESFYQGDIAERIVRQVRVHGGILSLEDLSTFQPRLVRPLRAEYRGHTICTAPPPSGGITMLQILQVLEHFDVAAMEPWSAPYLHLVAEATRICWPDRSLLGDPEFVDVPFTQLLAPSLASSRAAELRRGAVATHPASRRADSPHTCNVCVSDRFGNFVSLTATQGAQFGSGVVIDGLGLSLGHGMSRFEYLRPGHPNSAAPGKRPCHNMCPTLIFRDGKPFAALGLPGGTRIIPVTAQLAVSLIDFAASPAEAVHATRVHAEDPEPLLVSQSIPPKVAAELESYGHTLKRGEHALGTPVMVGGPANVIRADTGATTAASTAGPDAALVL